MVIENIRYSGTYVFGSDRSHTASSVLWRAVSVSGSTPQDVGLGSARRKTTTRLNRKLGFKR